MEIPNSKLTAGRTPQRNITTPAVTRRQGQYQGMRVSEPESENKTPTPNSEKIELQPKTDKVKQVPEKTTTSTSQPDPKAPKPMIVFENVTKVYEAQPNEPALYNLDVVINQGEFVFLVGHSGSGKSSFIKMIIRDVLPTEGQITVGGQDLIHMRNTKVPYLRRNIGCVFQDYKLLPNKTAYENVAFAMECVGKKESDIKTHVPEVLKLVGLEDKMDKFPNELSGGEQQRVSIARAIVNQPPLLICDEPTGNLDPETSTEIVGLLLRIHAAGTTVVMATHDKDIVNALKMRVIKLYGGHIVSDEQEGSYDGK